MELACLVFVALLLAWNSLTLLDLRARMSGHDEALNALISNRLEEIGNKLDGLLTRQSDLIQQGCKRSSEDLKSEFAALTPRVKALVDNACGSISADVGKQTSTLLEAMPSKSMQQDGDTSCSVESKIDTLEAKFDGISTHMDTIHTIVTGRDNADGLRAAYQRHAYETILSRHGEQVNQKMRTTNSRRRRAVDTLKFPHDQHLIEKKSVGAAAGGDFDMALAGKVQTVQSKQRRHLTSFADADSQNTSAHATEAGHETELLIVLPTFLRPKLEVNTEYVRSVVTSLSAQYKADLLQRKITLLIVNNSPKTHRGVAQAVEDVRNRKCCFVIYRMYHRVTHVCKLHIFAFSFNADQHVNCTERRRFNVSNI